MRTLSLTLTISWLVSSAALAETTISFDPRPAGNRVGIEGYTEGGMVFDDVQSPGSVLVADTGGVPSNGTAFVSQCGICQVTSRHRIGAIHRECSFQLPRFVRSRL